MKNLLITAVMSISLALVAGTALAGAPKHSAVKTVAKKKGNKVQLQFKVNAGKGMYVNYQGPWKLQLNDHSGLNVAKKTMKKAELDKKLPGFTVKASASKASGSVGYRMTTFVCTKDKTKCFREIHNGNVDW